MNDVRQTNKSDHRGVAVLVGMLGVTLFCLFLTPVFYVVVRSLALRVERQESSPKLQLEERAS